nr:immunoglobulin light chain junction region [Macaca mulatta]
CQHYYGIPHSF